MLSQFLKLSDLIQRSPSLCLEFANQAKNHLTVNNKGIITVPATIAPTLKDVITQTAMLWASVIDGTHPSAQKLRPHAIKHLRTIEPHQLTDEAERNDHLIFRPNINSGVWDGNCLYLNEALICKLAHLHRDIHLKYPARLDDRTEQAMHYFDMHFALKEQTPAPKKEKIASETPALAN